jgi:cellulose synthase (UDP-forming)
LKNTEIPYIPTAKQAVKGFTPFVRPMLIQQAVFIATLIGIGIKRGFFTAEASISLTSGETWGMMVFASISFFVSLGGIYAAWQSAKSASDDLWETVDLADIDVPTAYRSNSGDYR